MLKLAKPMVAMKIIGAVNGKRTRVSWGMRLPETETETGCTNPVDVVGRAERCESEAGEVEGEQRDDVLEDPHAILGWSRGVDLAQPDLASNIDAAESEARASVVGEEGGKRRTARWDGQVDAVRHEVGDGERHEAEAGRLWAESILGEHRSRRVELCKRGGGAAAVSATGDGPTTGQNRKRTMMKMSASDFSGAGARQ
jgi:hypothetical protein